MDSGVSPVVGGLAASGLMIVLTYEVTLDEQSIIFGGDSNVPILVLWATGVAIGVALWVVGKRVWAAAWLTGILGAVVACLGVLVYWISLGS